MVRKVQKEKSAYEKFFVFEAPKKKDRSITVIKTNPNRRNTDYTKNADRFDDVPEEDMDLVDDDENDFITDEDDYTANDDGKETPAEDEDAVNNGLSELDMDDDEDYTGGPDDGGTVVEPEGDQPDDETSAPMMDDEDYTGNTVGNREDQSASTEDNTSQAPPKSFDEQIKSYSLYNRYLKLYNAIKTYISKLDGMIRDSFDANLIIRTSTSQLRELEDLMRDYMTIQFQNASYVKSLLFYEKVLASVQLIFNLLENINTNDSSNPKQ